MYGLDFLLWLFPEVESSLGRYRKGSGPHSVCSLPSSLSGIFLECGGWSPHVRSSPCLHSQAPVLDPSRDGSAYQPRSWEQEGEGRAPGSLPCILALGPKPTLK